MKMKFNFGAFKGKKVKFLQHMADLTVSCSGTVKKVKEKSGNYIFNFELGEKLEIVDTVLARMIIRKEDDLITFTYGRYIWLSNRNYRRNLGRRRIQN